MGIVIITIPGSAQRAFVNALHERTSAVDLVVIQKLPRRSLTERLMRLLRSVGIKRLPIELWHAARLRLDNRLRERLEYFRYNGLARDDGTHLPPVFEVDSVNSDEVYGALRSLSPDLLVVWGSTILQHHIVATGKNAINLHFGLCPHYRGALANQHAIFHNDREHVGATIHHINGRADAGAVICSILANTTLHPRECFRALNDEARNTYLDIAESLYRGEELPTTSQDHLPSRTLLLREWTPSLRCAVALRMREWERDYATSSN